MNALTLDNPVFQTYLVAAAVVCLKILLQGWMTVFRMIKANGGFLNPEDAKQTFGNPKASRAQLEKDDYVDRSRRIHANDVENIPVFLAVGLLFVVTQPGILFAQICLYGFALARLLHFWAYVTARQHEIRALFFSVGSILTIIMTVHVLWTAIMAM